MNRRRKKMNDKLRKEVEEIFRLIRERKKATDKHQRVNIHTPSYVYRNCLLVDDQENNMEPSPVCKIGQHVYRHVTIRWGERAYTGFLRCPDASPPSQPEAQDAESKEQSALDRYEQEERLAIQQENLVKWPVTWPVEWSFGK
jgi:hypothetical protein